MIYVGHQSGGAKDFPPATDLAQDLVTRNSTSDSTFMTVRESPGDLRTIELVATIS